MKPHRLGRGRAAIFLVGQCSAATVTSLQDGRTSTVPAMRAAGSRAASAIAAARSGRFAEVVAALRAGERAGHGAGRTVEHADGRGGLGGFELVTVAGRVRRGRGPRAGGSDEDVAAVDFDDRAGAEAV